MIQTMLQIKVWRGSISAKRGPYSLADMDGGGGGVQIRGLFKSTVTLVTVTLAEKMCLRSVCAPGKVLGPFCMVVVANWP